MGTESLVPRARWITPRSLKKRWDTHFFAAILEREDVEADGVEIVSAEWMEPREAVRRALQERSTPDAIVLLPPQFYLLAELASVMDWSM